MYYTELLHSQLAVDPHNYAGHDESIDALADSIFEHGLLENIVVTPKEGPKGTYYLVKAGNRRSVALGLLVRQGRRSPDEPVMCLVHDDDPWIGVVENFQRREVAPWRTGFRLIELVESGYTNAEVGARIGMSNGTVSNYITIARGLHPNIMAKMERYPGGHKVLTKGAYLQIARCVNEDQQPMLERQTVMIEKMLATSSRKHGRGKPKSTAQASRDRVHQRLQSLLSGNTKIPPHSYLHVIGVLKYLAGESKRPEFPPAPPEDD